MKKTHIKTLKMFTVAFFIVGVCFYFSNNLNSELIAKIAYGGSLESSSGGNLPPMNSLDQTSSDISFLETLNSLEKIKIDTEFFKSKSFISLRDNSVKIDKVQPGRINPFAPIDNVTINTGTIVSKVITREPTQITDKSSVLNGTINTTDGVTDIYFEYGQTLSLGIVTENLKPSLVGAFIKNILGLTPKTNYFFKACAKINNVANCGEVVSFNTK